MKKRSKRKMFIVIGVLLAVIGVIMVFFNVNHSKTGTEFAKMAESLAAETKSEEGIFTEEDIAGLPQPVQKYFRYCGYIGTPKMSSMKITFENVDFMLDKERKIKIDYTQYNFIEKPARIAYIDSAMYGIPFEGLDSFTDGKGSMKGVLAKIFTLFDQTGETMDRACLVTFLSESLIIPSAALQEYVTWEEIDDLHAKATIAYYGITASGIFTFDESGAMLSFTTDDRTATSFDGTSEQVRWSAIIAGYEEKDGIKMPSALQAVWHYDDGDLVYFDGKDVRIEYDPK